MADFPGFFGPLLRAKPILRASGEIAALACSPDGEGLDSACTGGTVLRWEAAAWKGK